MTSVCVPLAQAFTAPPSIATPAGTALVVGIAGSGIDIVRMPTQPYTPSGQPPSIVPAPPQPPPRAAPIEPIQALGRTFKLPVKVGSVSSEPRKGWLGVSTDPLELPLALSLGRPNGNGALVLETTPGGPAAQAGARFGDIVVGFNGQAVDDVNDLSRRVLAAAPGAEAVLEVWRVTSDDGDFLRTLRRLGDSGNAYVMYRLGRMYAAGIGLARDDVEAVRWFSKGASAGNVQAMTALAIAQIEGKGTGKDPQEAVRLLRAAADKDNVEATYRLGVLLAQGKVVDKDALEAVRLLGKASDAGHTTAMVDLGLMYNHGLGVQTDMVRAAHWYKRAADHGNPAGMMSLGYLHQQGKGVEQSDVAAATLYRKAAALGNVYGIHNLAAMLDRGKGVERRDPEQAADLVLRALEMGNRFSYEQMTKNSHGWSLDFRRALQKKLRDAGFFTGRIDGSIRAPTIAAIDAYINRSGRRTVASGAARRTL